ncbi:MAG: diguanylate cyclase [Gammaproteobacteria bacterium]|nr:diguanylate cyclase [Gammaproteobacteria bacterium]
MSTAEMSSSGLTKSEAVNLDLTAQELDYLQQTKQITMCIDPDWMPLESIEGGKHIGMTADYMAILEKKIALPIVLIPTSTWVQSIEFAKARKCDIVSLAMATKERRQYMNFTQPYLSIPVVVATKTDEFFIADISKISDKKLGVVRGYAFGEILRDKYPEMNIIDVDSLKQGLEMVNQGELFGFIGTLVTIGYEFQRNFVGELKIAGKFDEKWQLSVATRNDEPLLQDIFDKAIASISEKQKQDILNQWLAIRYEKVVDYSDIWKWLVAIALLLSFFLYRYHVLKKYNTQLELISVTDKLTQVYNRVKLDEILEQQEKLYQRYQQVFSIIIIDIDYFKSVNDQFGHQAGDTILIEFSQLIKDNVRATDILGRWGGEEFMLISPKTNANNTYIMAEKIRKIIENHSFQPLGTLTSSFGVAQYQKENSSINDLVEQADRALYKAKQEGRNRTIQAKFN